MPDMPWSFFSPFSQTFGRFINDPVTNWQRFFNPQVVFNYNPQDEGVEAHVLAQVGSYGSQLSTLIDAIQALLSHAKTGDWSDEDRAALSAFDKLRAGAQEAVDQYRGNLSAEDIFKSVQALKKRDPTAAEELRQRLLSLLQDTVANSN